MQEDPGKLATRGTALEALQRCLEATTIASRPGRDGGHGPSRRGELGRRPPCRPGRLATDLDDPDETP
jgi:hypothetical protein